MRTYRVQTLPSSISNSTCTIYRHGTCTIWTLNLTFNPAQLYRKIRKMAYSKFLNDNFMHREFNIAPARLKILTGFVLNFAVSAQYRLYVERCWEMHRLKNSKKWPKNWKSFWLLTCDDSTRILFLSMIKVGTRVNICNAISECKRFGRSSKGIFLHRDGGGSFRP